MSGEAREHRGRTEREGRGLAWRRLGAPARPPLLMLNGYAATSADWDPRFLELLAASFDLVCPDPRGLGDSELGGEGMTIESLASDALAVLDALGLERATVAGWSMGGFVAQQLAAAHPRRVAALALLATDPGAEAERAHPEDWARLTDHGGTPSAQAERVIGLLFPPGPAAEVMEQAGAVVAAARAGLDPAALSAQERAMEAWHATPGAARLASISAPAAIAAGEEDVVIPAANARLLASGLPGSRLDVLEGCGHALMAQQPERVAGLIADLAASA